MLLVRLSAQLLHTTWQQTELQCQSDLAKLREWSHKFDLYATKQVWMPKEPQFIMFNLVAKIPHLQCLGHGMCVML